MARGPTKDQWRQLQELIAKMEPELRATFEAAIYDLIEGIDWQALVDALTAYDMERAINAMNIEPAAFMAYATAKSAAFAQAGVISASTISVPGVGRIEVRFNMRDPRAERWISENVWGQIEGWMQQEQLQTLRSTMLTGFEAGRHPHDIARDVAGRVVNGRRQGGVIGLDAGRAHRLTEVTRLMETPEGVQSLVTKGRDGKLTLKYRVNKATEARIVRAFNKGEAVPKPDREISVRQFSNALMKDRADQIAQDGSAEAVFAGRKEAWDQVLAAKGYPPEAVEKVWRHGGGPKEPRPHHVAMSGHKVIGLDTPFQFSNGTRLRWPHDVNGPVSETTRCSCGCDFRLSPTWGIE